MQKLSFDNYERAKKYLFIHGRELEQRLFDFEFGKGSLENVIQVLRKHQNEDGGFQNMGEGDKQCSSPIGTSVAFQYLVEVGATSSEALVQRGIKYLLQSYDEERNYWQPDTGRIYDTVSDMIVGWGNPSAELVGYLHRYSELIPASFLQKVTETALDNLNALEDPINAFSMLSFLRMSACTEEPIKSAIIKRFKYGIGKVIEKDSTKWSSYCAKPFWFATSPSSPLFDVIRENVLQSLSYEVATQSTEGNFILNWHVIGDDERTWKSIWTLDALKALKQHGMIETLE